MLINPINFRLSISIFWNSTWSFYKNSNYKYLFYSDLIFFEFFMFFFRKILNLKSIDYYPSHLRLYRLNDKIIINLYYHVSKEEYFLNKIDFFHQNLQKKYLKQRKVTKKTKNVIKKFIKIILLKILFNNIILKKKIIDLNYFLNLKWEEIKKEIKNIVGLTFFIEKKVIIKKYFFNLGKKYIYYFSKKNNVLKQKNLLKKKKIEKLLFNLDILYKKKERINIIFYKIKYNYLNINFYQNLSKINNNILKINWKEQYNVIINNDFYFLYKINLLKFIYNQKLWIFNIYYYFLSKYFKKITKIYFFKYLKKFELNIFKINKNMIKSNVISKYITTSLKNNYNIYETMRPILVDLKQYMIRKRVIGFKIAVSGRFKRAQRATYWWRKDGHLFTGTQTFGVDYSASLHRTKYGACTINVWLTYGLRGFDQLKQEYPNFSPFFFLLKKNYFILKKNSFFFFNLIKKNEIVYYNIKYNYVKGLILNLIYKYIYNYIFLKNILIKNFMNGINKYLKRIFLPQYCIYKIFLEDFLKKNYIKIIPFIYLKLLKRINLRNSYKIKFLQLNKLMNLKIFKYKIFLN